jgi:hypothetical protein
VFKDTFDELSPLWVEFPWFPPRNGVTVENGSLFVRTEPFNPFPTGEEATTLGPRSDTFPHYPEAKAWQGPGAYFQARFRYTNNPWTVPAFWLYSSGRAQLYPNEAAWCPNTNPEWDIVEGNIASYGADRLSTMGLHKNTNSYCGITDEVQVNWGPDHGSGLSDWHIWSGLWTDCCLIQFLDGVSQTSMEHHGWLNDDLFLILHIDEGSTTPPGNPPPAWQYELEVSDVEVWELP